MNIIIQGLNKKIVLNNNNYITEGGEGKIFGSNNLIFKILLDPKKLNITKINELSKINIDNVISPQNIVLTENNQAIGYTMKWIKNTVPICKLFTNDFRNRFSISPNVIIDLINRLCSDIDKIHKLGFVIVDGNELNYLIDINDFKTPYFIDVDSWQTKNFPATAIMPTIRDYHSKNFNDLSDWFTFAILACQLFIGIHPYKGRHPNFKMSDVINRMKSNVSIFNSEVSLPKATRDLSLIPDNYKQWLISVLEHGKRLPPPLIAGSIIVPIIKIENTLNSFITKLIKETETIILNYTNEIIKTENKLYYRRYEYPCNVNTDFVFSKKSLTPLKVEIENNKLKISYLNGIEIPSNFSCTDKTIINECLYIKNENNVLEVDFEEINDKLIPVVKSKWNILENSTTFFNGIIYQDVLGVPYFLIPYKNNLGKSACCIKQILELKNNKILEMKHELGVVFVIAYDQNEQGYKRFIFKFDDSYTNYKCIVTTDFDLHIPNFVVLDNNIVVSINPLEEVELFNRNIDNDKINILKDDGITFDMKLCKFGTSVFYRKNNKLFSLTMKK